MLRLVTGRTYSVSDLERMAGEIVTAKKRYNIAQGWQPDEDTLPRRFLTTPLATTPRSTGSATGPRAEIALTADRLGDLVACYNRTRGWTDDGWPTLRP